MTDIERFEQAVSHFTAAVDRLTATLVRPDVFVTEAEVCTEFGVSAKGLRRRIYIGQFPQPDYGCGTKSRWKRSTIQSFNERRR